MKKRPSSDEILSDIASIEKFITQSIELDFPVKIDSFIEYDNEEGNFVGVFLATNQMLFSFYIEKGDRPWLQRYVPRKLGEE